jgi:hypothetical protein
MLSLPAAEITAATSTVVQLPLLVTGCGRSGTKYIAFALRRIGLDVRHERLGRDGISSWTMAVRTERRPYGPPSSACSFNQIFHQTREPLQVIQSCLSFTESSWDFISENVPCSRIAPLIIRAATYWLLWNEKAEEIATWRYRIEDFPDLVLEEFHYRLKGFYDRRSIDRIPRDFNTRKQGRSFHLTEEAFHRIGLSAPSWLRSTVATSPTSCKVTWARLDALDPKLCAKLKSKAAFYGYAVDD